MATKYYCDRCGNQANTLKAIWDTSEVQDKSHVERKALLFELCDECWLSLRRWKEDC